MADQLYIDHSRRFQENRFVYPVVSRRSGGVSIGVNLNPDKVCNFDCIYCQVDRRTASETRFVALDQLSVELEQTLAAALDQSLFLEGRFQATPEHLRTVRDIAFSGDGEPTTYRNLDAIFQCAIDVKSGQSVPDLPMVLITNASQFHRPAVHEALRRFHAANGTIWAKLDAGTEAYYHQIARTTIPFERILKNITLASQEWPLVIQSLFMQVDGRGPGRSELLAYCQQLNDIARKGGTIERVQIYTIARQPAESCVTPLPNAEVDDLTSLVREETGLVVDRYYGVLSPNKQIES